VIYPQHPPDKIRQPQTGRGLTSMSTTDRAQEWADNDLPVIRAADLVQAAIDARDPYYNDRPYPRPQDWANGSNPFRRPNPEAPWVQRSKPEPLDAPEACPPRGVRCRRFVSFDRPEQEAGV
jgi:hypothetical protein